MVVVHFPEKYSIAIHLRNFDFATSTSHLHLPNFTFALAASALQPRKHDRRNKHNREARESRHSRWPCWAWGGREKKAAVPIHSTGKWHFREGKARKLETGPNKVGQTNSRLWFLGTAPGRLGRRRGHYEYARAPPPAITLPFWAHVWCDG